jgi:copper homeostasis protein
MTFNRAFDVVRDQRRALEDLIACRVPRVLTSGGQTSALQGLEHIRALVEQANGRIAVMPGGGITEGNAATVARCSGAAELHGTFRVGASSAMQYVHHPPLFALAGNGRGGDGAGGAGVWGRFRTDGDEVARTKQRLAEELGGSRAGEMGP